MTSEKHSHTRERERELGERMREVASELRLIDVVELVSYIQLGKFAHLENLVCSSTEMYFKPGSLIFGSSADVHLVWGSAPTIWLDMEFRHRSVHLYFSLVLESHRAGVEINHMSFCGASADGAENTRRLVDALDDARRLETPVAVLGALLPARAPLLS